MVGGLRSGCLEFGVWSFGFGAGAFEDVGVLNLIKTALRLWPLTRMD